MRTLTKTVMNRNVESHFSELPSIDIERSRFDRSSSHKTSFNVGELIPFYVDEVLPGDTFDVSTSCVVRLQTLLTPVMDNIYLDTYYFFVPYRLVWDHWKEFMGENTSSAWLPATSYTIPRMSAPSETVEGETVTGWNTGTIADYMGIPVGTDFVANNTPSALPFRAYAMICDQWFRDQNLEDPVNIYTGDNLKTGSNGSNQITDIELGGKPFKVAKYHDYFTSCLPSPQKGAGVTIFGKPVGSTPSTYDPSQMVPVISYSTDHSRSTNSLHAYSYSGATTIDYKINLNYSSGNVGAATGATPVNTNSIRPQNLYAEVGELNLSINQLRLAFQMQKWQEKAARGGTRYREILKEMFSVTPEDSRMMIPEYLGGHRFPLQIHQVANQAQGENDFLGDLGAMSNTVDSNDDFIKSFTEHGIVIGVCCARYDHSYPQGMERFWWRSDKFDFYWPVFANIGEQAVRKGEIFIDGSNDYDVFGYQEAWADYRYKPNRVSGEMRPGIPNSLASWHLSDYYLSTPSLSAAWIREDKANVDRALAVTSAVSNQIFADFYIQNYCTRPMPMYSIPGLIDHH